MFSRGNVPTDNSLAMRVPEGGARRTQDDDGERVAVWTACCVDDIFQAPRGKRHDKPRGAGCRVEYGHDVCVIEQTLDSDLALHSLAGVLDVAARSFDATTSPGK